MALKLEGKLLENIKRKTVVDHKDRLADTYRLLSVLFIYMYIFIKLKAYIMSSQ